MSNIDFLNSDVKPGFPLNSNGIVKWCDSSRSWLIVERLIITESKTLTEIGVDLQPNRFL